MGTKKPKYVVEYSKAKVGWCVYEAYEGKNRGIKLAGPYRNKSDADKEAGRMAS